MELTPSLGGLVSRLHPSENAINAYRDHHGKRRGNDGRTDDNRRVLGTGGHSQGDHTSRHQA